MKYTPNVKTPEEIELIRQSAQLVSKTLGMIAAEIKDGVTTQYLDEYAEQFIRDHGGVPGFKGLYGCPSTLLISVNDAVVHGLPTNRPLRDGDIASVDCGVLMNGYYGDHAYTFEIGDVPEATKKLCKVTLECLYRGIAKMRPGNSVGDIGCAIQTHAQKHGYGVVRELVGHALGKALHEDPQVPNYGKKGKGPVLHEGMVLAVEPMINMGTQRVKQLKDGWTVVTADGKPSAHFEHNIAIVNGNPEILSTFDFVEDVLGLPRTTSTIASMLLL